MLRPFAGALYAAGGLLDVDWTLNVATLVVFSIFAFVLARFAWAPILKMVQEREQGIKDAVEGAEKANLDAKALLEQHKGLIRDAAREREEILKKALKEADALKAELGVKAKAESDQIVARAREQVVREKDKAIQDLRSSVADLAMEAAAKIVKSSLSPEAQKQLVNEFINSMPRVQ